MEDLYRRMEGAITKLRRQDDIELTKLIMAWTTHSRRPLRADELLQALQPEHSNILDLRRTIDQLCGHFVEIDSNNYVTLVHYTAREYLINKSSIPFLLAPEDAHEELFRKTLSLYMHRSVRRMTDREILPPFYDYAATSWAYHLSRSSGETEDPLTLMKKFFSGNFVLPWIQALAKLRQLKVLVSTSQSLTTFVAQQWGYYQRRLLLLDRLSDLEILEFCATDLLKLVGKFGSNLLEEPSVIHDKLPPFCPQNSQICQFSQKSTGGLYLESLSNNDEWDDLLARLSVRSEHKALIITCSGRFLAVLTSTGTVTLWNSVTFEQVRLFKHDELVHMLRFSCNGNMLVTYGYETTKIWMVSTGSLLHKLTNPSQVQPLALQFSQDDSVLFVGLNTRNLATFELDSHEREWDLSRSRMFQEDIEIEGTVLNSPTAMQFSPDGAFVAIAHRRYPLSVWLLEPPRLVNRCRRSQSGRSSGASWAGVLRVVWHPRNGQVLGIYTDGSIFKWYPVEKTHQEIKTDSSPSEIQISFDGNVFLTGDVERTIKLYNTSLFHMIYQLSLKDIVTAIFFSPDGLRLCDIRGSCVNIWEPNSLLRLYQGDDEIDDNETWGGSMKSVSLVASEAWVETPLPITALSVRKRGDLLCIGYGDCSIALRDTSTSNHIEVEKPKSDLGIEHLTWAANGACFAYVELGSQLIVRAIEKEHKNGLPQTTRIIMKQSLSTRDGEGHHLILNPGAELVLVFTPISAQVWSLETYSICGSYRSPQAETPVRWISHPSKGDCLLAINQVIVSKNKAFILLFISRRGHQRRHRWARLAVFESASLAEGPNSAEEPLKTIPIPSDVTGSIERPLAVIGKNRLIFLDKSFWVCSWRLRRPGGQNPITRHFFLPRDWANAESLDLCQVLDDGTFLCPRKGEVAVIKSDLSSDW
ncbi:MAG: hypothetical protein MMC33_000815 [Icmadophila ericetorum]|nr:hypothetical protein [Icmadophila ericetorum]